MDMSKINETVIREYRAGEELSIPGIHRDKLVLLTTTGLSTGLPRVAPMMFVPTDESVLVIASADGAAEPPHWYDNLVADPQVHLEMPDDEYDAVARVLEGDERTTVWAQLVEDYPFFAEHQERAGREIPVVELTRAR